MADLNQMFKDSAYAAVGFGVLGFQKAQVRRHELTKQLQAQRKSVDEQLRTQRQSWEEQLATVERQLTDLAKSIEERVGPAAFAFSLRATS